MRAKATRVHSVQRGEHNVSFLAAINHHANDGTATSAVGEEAAQLAIQIASMPSFEGCRHWRPRNVDHRAGPPGCFEMTRHPLASALARISGASIQGEAGVIIPPP